MNRLLFALFVLLCLFSRAFAQEDESITVRVINARLNQACDSFTINGTITGHIPYVRVQLALHQNPMVLLVDEILTVENGAYSQENIELYSPVENALVELMAMVTGWDGSNYVTPLRVHKVFCSNGDDYHPNVAGLRYMRSSRQNWTIYSSFSAEHSLLDDESCLIFLENTTESFPETLLAGQSEEISFPVTLMIAENGFLLRLDWERHLFYMLDDGGFFYGQYIDSSGKEERDEIYYDLDLRFNSLNSVVGYLNIWHPSGCFWVFEWHGERSE